MKFYRYILTILALWLPAINAVTQLPLYQDVNAESEVQPVVSFSQLSAADGGEKFYIVNKAAGANEFSIAATTRFTPHVIPVMSKKITVNGVKDQDNPLYNVGISDLTMMTNDSAAIVAKDSNQVAYIERIMYPAGRSIIMSDALLDSNAQPASSIVKVAAIGDKMIAAVVAPHEKKLGDEGTGLALVSANTIKVLVEQETQEGEEKKEPKEENKQIFAQLNAVPDQPDIKSIPFDKSSNFIAFNHPLQSIDEKVVMHWDNYLRTMFIGISGQTGAYDDAAICGVTALNVLEKSIHLKSVLMPELLSDRQDEIVCAKGAHARVNIHNLKTLHTEMPQPDRMGISYLIVHGGTGDEQATKRTIYALPLVNKINSQETMNPDDQPYHALVARPSDLPVRHNQVPPRKPFVLKVSYDNYASNNAQLYTTQSTPENIPARVGAGPVPYGDVTNIFVVHDAVYAVVGTADAGHLPCVCFSQPIYDTYSRIVAWTQWQPAVTTTDSIIDAGLDATGYQLHIITSNGTAICVNKSKWESAQDKQNLLTTGVTQLFKEGVQLLQDYSEQGYMLAAGRKKVAIISQVCIDHAAGLTNQSADIKTFEQGALNCIECPTTSATITVNGQQYICVAGVGGIALAASNNPLTDELSFTKLGSYKYVRKLIAMDDCLYVLTDKTIDRINMSASNIAANNLSVVTVVDVRSQLRNQYATLSDMIVSGKLLLVGSSLGLYRNVDNSNVATASGVIELQKIEIPEDTTAISHLYSISITGKISDVSRTNGMVYVVTGSRGKNRARLHRLAVADTYSHAVNQATVQLIQDCIIHGTPCEFRNLGAYYDHIFAQGTLFLNARNNDATQPTVVNRGFRQSSHSLFTGIDEKASVHAITRNAARGNVFIAGDFGLQMQ